MAGRYGWWCWLCLDLVSVPQWERAGRCPTSDFDAPFFRFSAMSLSAFFALESLQSFVAFGPLFLVGRRTVNSRPHVDGPEFAPKFLLKVESRRLMGKPSDEQ